MGITALLLLSYFLVFILIILIISLLLRIKTVERKLVNFSPTEAYSLMETMRDMVIESERVADDLDRSIKSREDILEDLSVLVDEKIARLELVLNGDKSEKDLGRRIAEMSGAGASETQIARSLGVSVTEVRLALSLLKR